VSLDGPVHDLGLMFLPPCLPFPVPGVFPHLHTTDKPNTWPRPRRDLEPSRLVQPLELLHELSSAPQAWRPLVIDEDWRCFASIWPKAVDQEHSRRFFERLLHTAPWVELWNQKGTSVTRSTCWYVHGECTCAYTYGRDLRMENCNRAVDQRVAGSGVGEADSDHDGLVGETSSVVLPEEVGSPSARPVEFLNLMEEITEHVFGNLFPGLGRETWPNSANVNLYRDGRQAVGWHADDESLFRGWDSDCPILSISLGATREFWIALKRDNGSTEPDQRTVVEVDLQDGDVLTMEGRCQRHCVHFVPKANPRSPVREERINITFRWVRDHKSRCPLRRAHKVPSSPSAWLGSPCEGIFGEGSASYSSSMLLAPYVRCWTLEVPEGALANPMEVEWRLCDGCKHSCFEDGRACCQGRGEWEHLWFCRHCWAKWAPASPERPGPAPQLPPLDAFLGMGMPLLPPMPPLPLSMEVRPGLPPAPWPFGMPLGFGRGPCDLPFPPGIPLPLPPLPPGCCLQMSPYLPLPAHAELGVRALPAAAEM